MAKASDTGLAVVGLQQKLPRARVLYMSATGATEVSNLAYADRLGLSGPATAFPTMRSFVTSIESGGVAAMELVARDLKATGSYISRSLGFQGIEYERLDHVLTPEQREMYDKLCEGWQIALKNFNTALSLVASNSEGKVDSRAKGRAMSSFWGAHQRFFNYIVCSLSLPTVIKHMEAELTAGHCCVLQLVNTNAAAMERQLAKIEEDDDLGDIDLTPRDQLLQLVEHCFPVHQMEEYADDNGNTKMRPVTNSKGDLVKNRVAVGMRERLLDELSSIRVPEGPLEMIINHFGHERVAEVTGRSRRVVRKDVDGTIKTVIETRSQSRCIAETAEFQAGKRDILVFSDAGGVGASYHASRKCANQKKRIHYPIQPGWVADRCIQGFGRTHRSDQAVPPKYVLPSTDLKGQARFISSIARRLDQLGALTRGERKAAKGGLFSRETDNLESPYARQALYVLYRDIYNEKIPNFSIEEFQEMTGLYLVDKDGELLEQLPPITRFLNRILSLPVDTQNRVFGYFMDRFERIIDIHIAEGTLDRGTEDVKADRVTKMNETVVYTDPRSGAQTKLVELKLEWKNVPITFDELMSGRKTFHKDIVKFAYNAKSGQTWAFTQAENRTDARSGVPRPHYHQIGTSPQSHHYVPKEEIDLGDNWIEVESDDARERWTRQVEQSPAWIEGRLYLVCGTVLAIWDRLKGDVKAQRARTVDGQVYLGRVIQEKHVKETLRNLGANISAQSYMPEELLEVVRDGGIVTLANGWKIKHVMYSYSPRVEIVGPNYPDGNTLRGIGIIFERNNYKPLWLLPADPDNAVGVLTELIRLKPIAEVCNAND